MGKHRNLEEVKAYIDDNENRLKNCRHHDFQRPNNDSLYNFTYICRKCGGRVDLMAKTYYEIGYLHGRQE